MNIGSWYLIGAKADEGSPQGSHVMVILLNLLSASSVNSITPEPR
jgi:hypothetical protein